MDKKSDSDNWYKFSERYPEPNKKIKIDINGLISQSKTYLRNDYLMIGYTDDNKWFQGYSPKILDQSNEWCYVDEELNNKTFIEKFQEILDNLNKIKPHNRNGYILLPSIEGFDLFEISEDRLRKYLVAEQLYLKSK